jgi:hypothetical protein
MSERPDTKSSTALKITNQFRSDGGMAYDLKCEGVRLTLVIAERTRADDPAAWRIEARGSLTADQKATLLEWGTTREEALQAIARAWASSIDTTALRVFDWEAVAAMLRTVRAL